MILFERALAATLWMEGVDVDTGLVDDDPDDPGGPTNFGVSLRFLRSIGKDIDGDGDVDETDIVALDGALVTEIYHTHFWLRGSCDRIRSGLLAAKIFDMCVNLGVPQAWRVVQRVLNREENARLVVDGNPGPKTLDALDHQTLRDWSLIEAIRFEQRARYDWLMGNQPSLGKYRLGWYRRAAY